MKNLLHKLSFYIALAIVLLVFLIGKAYGSFTSQYDGIIEESSAMYQKTVEEREELINECAGKIRYNDALLEYFHSTAEKARELKKLESGK